MIEQRVFNNRYRLEGKLGEGGMALVFCGVDTLLRRRVAIKVLRDQYASDAEFVKRFYQEAEAAAKLSHPNVVATYDVGREGDTYFIVMELVDGPSLADLLSGDRRLPEPVAIAYATQMCNGLAYAHRQGLLHRDIKPANMLITKDDTVKLSDFGIARAVSQQTMALTKPGLVMGSVFYMSPEQAQGHKLHPTSDLYSLGVVLYQMLTGRLPYTGESPVTVALKHVSEPVPTLDPQSDDVSPALASVTNRLLQKRHEHRFASASDAAVALREARERPSVVGFEVQDDSMTLNFARSYSQSLPPRRSPMPDRDQAVVESYRSRNAFFFPAILIVALFAAVIAGYLLFSHGALGGSTGVAIADYTNLTDAQAEEALVNAGLTVRLIRTASNTVAANHVIRQNPAAGAIVPPNGVIELFVSNGAPLVGLQDVRGYTLADASRDLKTNKMEVHVVHRFDDSPKGSVVDQRPKSGAQVRVGAIVTLIVSDGPKPVNVPSLIGLTDEQARTLASTQGFTLDDSVHQAAPGTDAGTILSQDPAPGTTVTRHTVVHTVVSDGDAASTLAIPDLHDASLSNAQAALVQRGFLVNVIYRVESDENGRVVDQTPPAGTLLGAGSTVTVTLSVPGEVPDTEGMSVDQARAALMAAGYAVGSMTYTRAQGSDGNVIGTTPDVGTTLPPGSSVTLIVNQSGH